MLTYNIFAWVIERSIMKNLILELEHVAYIVHVLILQFGMLIQYLFDKFPNIEDINEFDIGDLQVR
jgi:hypothetical protein